MSISAPILITLLAIGAPRTDFFGDVNRRNIADVAAELDSVAKLSPAAFNVVAPSVLDVVKTSRSSALRLRAMDLLCAKANANRVGELIAYLDECLDGLQQDKRQAHYGFIEAFVSSDLSTWGGAMRSSPATIVFLNRLVRYRRPDSTKSDLNPTVGDMAGKTIFELMPDVAGKRQAMLALIRDRTRGSCKAAQLLPAITDAETITALRTILNEGDLNIGAMRALEDLGDAQSLPILERRRSELEALSGQPFHDLLRMVKRTILRINLQQQRSDLLAYIRDPSATNIDPGHYWAIKKALSLDVPTAEIRAAILQWAAHAPSQIHLIDMKRLARELGILEPADLAATPDGDIRKYMSHGYPPKRRSGPVPVPTRREKRNSWSPNEANYEALGEWMGTVQWQALPEGEASQLLKGKLCELDLLHPENCNDGP